MMNTKATLQVYEEELTKAVAAIDDAEMDKAVSLLLKSLTGRTADFYFRQRRQRVHG
jgi:hypothetical protein